MTESEWVDVFSALMTGADLSYPDRSHQVVWNLLRNLEFPISMKSYAGFVIMPAYAWQLGAGGAYTTVAATTVWLNVIGQQATPAINNWITTEYYALQAGDYRWRYIYNKSNSSGKASLLARRTLGTTVSLGPDIDQYAAVASVNNVATGTFTLTTSENFNFEKHIDSKNASSSGYNSQFAVLEVWHEE